MSSSFSFFFDRFSLFGTGDENHVKTLEKAEKLWYSYYNNERSERGSTVNLQESGEMYLESILILLKQRKDVRSVDVGEYMGFSKPSVSRAVGLLRSGGYITVDESGFIDLTADGREVAEKIYERHTFLTEYLIRLGVDPDVAAEDACKMEHDISDESFRAIRNHFSDK